MLIFSYLGVSFEELVLNLFMLVCSFKIYTFTLPSREVAARAVSLDNYFNYGSKPFAKYQTLFTKFLEFRPSNI